MLDGPVIDIVPVELLPPGLVPGRYRPGLVDGSAFVALERLVELPALACIVIDSQKIVGRIVGRPSPADRAQLFVDGAQGRLEDMRVRGDLEKLLPAEHQALYVPIDGHIQLAPVAIILGDQSIRLLDVAA